MGKLPKTVAIKIVNLKELEEKVELAKKLIKEIKGFNLKFETENVDD
tara:strand:- start:13 stop:153 length:141 start_codon:yes stop_codon:yes gene_type:complete